MKTNFIHYIALVLLVCSAGLLGSCKDDDGHNAGSPVVVNRFYPTSGSAGTEILITGKNFTTNVDEVSVMVGNIPLTVMGCDMNNIMAIVPARMGDGQLKVSIAGREPVSTIESFVYSFAANVSTFAGNGEAGYQDGKGAEAMLHLDVTEEDNVNWSYGPWQRGSICVDDDGNVYVGEAGNVCVRKITPDGTVTTLAGFAGQRGFTDGTGVQARFSTLYGMDTDAAGNVYVTETGNNTIRQITQEGVVTTLGNTSNQPWALAVDKRNGDIYYTHPATGVWKFNRDGEDTQVGVNESALLCMGIVVDNVGDIYVSEAANSGVHRIVKYMRDGSSWQRSVIAGNTEQTYVDGSFNEARFSFPGGLAVGPDGNIYVAGNGAYGGDINNADQSIRVLDLQNRVVRTVAGSSLSGYNDANGSAATFSGPEDVAVDKNGLIYVLDRKNNVVRKIVYE
ncbi:IPT/TIG domain-containing protein [Bacteroides xylanisolvens]|uniref:IPT/TIG domain-containing protein n=1 Tax=Bacteroides xylanisolvens TaxID=371601 RepID=UPI002307F9FE|nr:IPT/TIG domain-containing protein [Bacteroides xylanisolvens]MDB0717262.1 IPT/TIG domain-containing protein [Bacteroides xylanisolvens]MDB0737720.1 IPT/TIG domain-containing protein [Bacteroides xylanisolvens]